MCEARSPAHLCLAIRSRKGSFGGIVWRGWRAQERPVAGQRSISHQSHGSVVKPSGHVGCPARAAITGKQLIKTIGGSLNFVWDLSVLGIGHRGA
jgi:hypothetical protein